MEKKMEPTISLGPLYGDYKDPFPQGAKYSFMKEHALNHTKETLNPKPFLN